jgi:hypothetical protein
MDTKPLATDADADADLMEIIRECTAWSECSCGFPEVKWQSTGTEDADESGYTKRSY